jgi:hypothetical protein
VVRQRASTYKNWTQLLGLVVTAAGAATSFFQVFTPATWVPAVTAGLGALVTLSEGWQRIARYGETWVAYRNASERMKRERRLCANGAGAYRGLDDDTRYCPPSVGRERGSDHRRRATGLLAEPGWARWCRAADRHDGAGEGAGAFVTQAAGAIEPAASVASGGGRRSRRCGVLRVVKVALV